MSIDIYTDGGCSGNPGPGAWAFVIKSYDKLTEGSGFNSMTTNNRMELQAVIRALEAVEQINAKNSETFTVYTDSQYVKNGITQWIQRWERNGWKTSRKEPVKNQDLWVMLKNLTDTLPIRWEWLEGHAGHELNERCDSIVQAEIRKHTEELP